MKKSIMAFSMLLTGGFASNAFAGQVTCSSKDGKYMECPLDGGGEIVMKQQLSKTGCVKDKTWGETGDGVYVKGGCRAIFETMSMNQSQNSGSGESGYQDLIGAKAAGGEMDLQDRGYTFVRTTIQGNSKLGFWWKPNRSGCIQVTTSDGRYSAIRDVNSSQCSQDGNLTSGQATAGGISAEAMNACNMFMKGEKGRFVSSTALKPGWQEVILRYNAGEYACTVNNDGRVDGFVKM
jgi:hypothetical protein